MKDRTVFVIAHRLSTVRKATRIAVIESGQITEMGTHEELMQHSGTYRRLYNMQFSEEDQIVPAGGGDASLVAGLEGIA
jgi:subfamily B ATP-binding cassette protein MsbA